MAVGDVVNGVDAGAMTFQPASGVEVVLLSYGTNRDWVKLTDGSDSAYVFMFADNDASGTGQRGTYNGAKLCINNTIYVSLSSGADGSFYSGCLLYTSPSPRD